MLLYYVYALLNPINNQIFYIGKGVSDRGLSHLKNPNDSEKGNVIKLINKEGKTPKVLILAKGFKTESEALALESLLILQANYYNDVFGIKAHLTNIVAGHHADNFRAFGDIQESEEWEINSNLRKSKKSKNNLYKEVIERVEIFNEPQKSQGGYISSKKMSNGFEFVINPKGEHRVVLEYINRDRSEINKLHSQKIHDMLQLGQFKNNLGQNIEHARVDIELKLSIFQSDEIIDILNKFMSEIAKAEECLT